MGLLVRDDRQMKAFTGLSHAPFDSLLPGFSDMYQTARKQMYEQEVLYVTRQRKPGGGSKGQLPTRAEKWQFVLYASQTYPTFDVLGQQCAMARSKANANLQKHSPLLYAPLVHLERMPDRAFAPPEELQAALHGVARLLLEAPARAYHRSTEDPKQREHASGPKTAYAAAHCHVSA